MGRMASVSSNNTLVKCSDTGDGTLRSNYSIDSSFDEMQLLADNVLFKAPALLDTSLFYL